MDESNPYSRDERIRPGWRALFDPLDIAAYVTWSAVLFEVVFDPGVRIESPLGHALPPMLMLVFLGLFLATNLSRPNSSTERVLVFSQIAIALGIIAASDAYSTPVLLIIGMAQVGIAFSGAGLVAIAIVVNAILYALLELVWGAPRALLQTLLYVGFQAFAVITAGYAVRAERASGELREVNAHLLATRSLLEASARDAERLRLARELHDVAGHTLTALKLNLVALSRDPALAHRTELATAVTLADQLLGDIRGVVRQMRLHEGVALEAALRQLAAPFPRPAITLDVADDAKVDDVAQAEALLRAAQEALTNAARHADASRVVLSLRRVDGGVALEVRDDGRGARALAVGHGLRGMRERLEAVGGTLDFGNTRDGFAVRAFLPSASSL